ncbi:MerR family transcriptional regulator [Streptomyces graminilatus]|uniref:MerR family transcriptional regulator n=1 Tax=Streptomyces graminilatus TaxID=1464070 RepID=UPI0006E39D59|nr:MerR family transcriptional regulator [Streptomyces graminilatus]
MEYLSLPPGLLTASMAARACGVKPATIRDWVRRGILTRAGGSPKRPYYRVTDVTEAMLAAKPSRPGQRGVTAA